MPGAPVPFAAARMGDQVIVPPPAPPLPGVLIGGIPTVLIGGLPAATAAPPTMHQCSTHPTPLPVAPMTPPTHRVFIGGLPALRVTDLITCAPPKIVFNGCPTVLIGAPG